MERSFVDVRFWPELPVRDAAGQLTLGHLASAPKYRCEGSPRTQRPGQLLSMATGSFLASRLIDVVLDETANWSPERCLSEAGIDRLVVP